jgi:hypothetical protein
VTKFLLSLHVIAAIIAVGPVTVAASMFPAVARNGDVATLTTLNRICRVYAAVGVAVPTFGFMTASVMGVLGDTWLIVSIVLTAIAAGVLALVILPIQAKVLDAPARNARLAMYTGLFNLLWVAVTVLMIVRPGSTTGA